MQYGLVDCEPKVNTKDSWTAKVRNANVGRTVNADLYIPTTYTHITRRITYGSASVRLHAPS